MSLGTSLAPKPLSLESVCLGLSLILQPKLHCSTRLPSTLFRWSRPAGKRRASQPAAPSHSTAAPFDMHAHPQYTSPAAVRAWRPDVAAHSLPHAAVLLYGYEESAILCIYLSRALGARHTCMQLHLARHDYQRRETSLHACLHGCSQAGMLARFGMRCRRACMQAALAWGAVLLSGPPGYNQPTP